MSALSITIRHALSPDLEAIKRLTDANRDILEFIRPRAARF